MDIQVANHLKGIIEALLFVSEKPITLDQIKETIEGVSAGDIKDLISALQKEFEERKSGMMILEIAEGFQMLTNCDYAMYIKKFYRTSHKEKLSKPALETLAIVAYKQAVSRLDVELIRGVNCDGVIIHLLEKGLIKIVGRKDIPGRPYIYGTTKEFLEYFGLKSLEDLPKLEDFSNLKEPADESAQENVQVESVPAENSEAQTVAAETVSAEVSANEESVKNEPTASS